MPNFPIADILPDPNNVRANMGDLASLTASIRELGVVQPLVLRHPTETEPAGKLIVVAGHRRLAAAVAAELTEVPGELSPLPVSHEPGTRTAMQAAENMVRLPLSAVEQWRAIERLRKEGYSDQGAAAALGIEPRRLRRLQLLGRLHAPILDAIERDGHMPHDSYLRTIANAEPKAQAEAWKRHKPKKGEAVSWHALQGALAVKRLLRADAQFTPEIAERHGVTWQEDLFAQPEESEHTTNFVGFMAAQFEWLTEVVMPQLHVHGIRSQVMQPGRSYPVPVPRGMQQAWPPFSGAKDRPAPWLPGGASAKFTRLFWIDESDGRIRHAYAEAEPGRQGRAAPAAPKAPEPLTKKGLDLIDQAKRRAAAAAAAEAADPYALIGALTACLIDRLRYLPIVQHGAMTITEAAPFAGLLAPDGTMALDAADAEARIAGHARTVLARALAARATSHGSYIGRGTVELVGEALGARATLPAQAEVLRELKGPALDELRKALATPGAKSQGQLRGQIIAALGDEPITANALRLLAWEVAPIARSEEEAGDGGEDDADPSEEGEPGE